MKRTRLQFILTLVLFAAAVAVYFLPHGNLRISLAFPAAVLALGSVCMSPWTLTAALLFCAVGDTMGVMGSLPGQMGGFAVGHVFFLLLLGRGVARLQPRTRVWLPVTLTVLAVLALIACKVVPNVPGMGLKVGAIVYATLLLSVCGLSMVAALAGCRREQTVQRPLAGWRAVAVAVGALSFVFSDFVIAWNRFVEHVPNAQYIIMSTYYTALLLLFLALTPRHTFNK